MPVRTGPIHYSELSAVSRCPQKHHYSYVKDGGLRARHEALNLKRGLWLHSMLEVDALRRGLDHGSLLMVPEVISVPGIDAPAFIIHGDDVDEPMLAWGDLGGTEHGPPEETFEFLRPLGWKAALELLETRSDYAVFPDSIIEERYTEGGQTLPEACRNIMRGYLWQNRNVLPKRRPLLVEVEWARTLTGDHPDVDMEGRADYVEITENGVVVLGDWKTTKSLPGQEFKLMEAQRWIYAWGLEDELAHHDVTVRGLEFNYLVTATPTKPKQNQPKSEPKRKTKCSDCEGEGQFTDGPCPACEGEGKRLNMPTPNELKGELSKAQIRTTPLVYFEALKEYGLEVTPEHREKIDELEQDQDFYVRHVLPLNRKVLATVLEETASRAQQAEAFRSGELKPYRNIDRSCNYLCDFLPLCMAELYGQDVSTLIERDYEPKMADEEVDA